MKIAVAKEIDVSEPRVAVSPDTIRSSRRWASMSRSSRAPGSNRACRFGIYRRGATVSADALKDADIIIKVKRPEASELAKYKRGALVIAIMDPMATRPR